MAEVYYTHAYKTCCVFSIDDCRYDTEDLLDPCNQMLKKYKHSMAEGLTS